MMIRQIVKGLELIIKKGSVLLGFLFFVATVSCEKKTIPPFTVTMINPFDFDVLVIGRAEGCDYEKATGNLNCILGANEKQTYDTYGQGRSFLVNVYKAGTEYMVGWVNFVGEPDKQYQWVIGFDSPVIAVSK